MEKEEKFTKEKKRKIRFFKRYNFAYICCILISFCLVFYFISLQLTLSKKQQHLNEIQSKINLIEVQNGEIKTTLSGKNEKEVIEKIAREQYGYVSPDDRVFYDISAS